MKNKQIVNALRKIAETKWNGNTIHDSLEKCLRALNNESKNSGWYNPTAIKIGGLTGIYMINEDGSIYFDSRIIKIEEKSFRIEYLSNSGYDQLEQLIRAEIKQ